MRKQVNILFRGTDLPLTEYLSSVMERNCTSNLAGTVRQELHSHLKMIPFISWVKTVVEQGLHHAPDFEKEFKQRIQSVKYFPPTHT